MSKGGSNDTCSAIITIDCVYKRDENYYSRVFLEESKYIENKVIRHTSDSLKFFLTILMNPMKNKLNIIIGSLF